MKARNAYFGRPRWKMLAAEREQTGPQRDDRVVRAARTQPPEDSRRSRNSTTKAPTDSCVSTA